MKAVTTTQDQIKLFSNVSKKYKRRVLICSMKSVHSDNKIRNQQAKEQLLRSIPCEHTRIFKNKSRHTGEMVRDQVSPTGSKEIELQHQKSITSVSVHRLTDKAMILLSTHRRTVWDYGCLPRGRLSFSGQNSSPDKDPSSTLEPTLWNRELDSSCPLTSTCTL